MNLAARYAVYLTPEPEEPLWHFGSCWLGYDARTRCDVQQPLLSGVPSAALREATAHPRLYGLHLTLKAPFRLADGASPDDLEATLAIIARRHDPIGPFSLALEARKAGRDAVFLCLAPQIRQPALHQLEADAVITLDALRAPLTAEEIARRKPESLERKSREYLELYGYPHVLDAFRPHISLTGPIAPASPVRLALAEQFAANPELHQLFIQSLALFEQPEPGARFFIRRYYPLGVGGR